MKNVRNTTRKPLAVPLPGGRKLHLGPGQSGDVSAHAAAHPPLVALITAGQLELTEGGPHDTGSAAGGPVNGSSAGFRAPSRSSGRGDR
jgi:hypothetical protein